MKKAEFCSLQTYSSASVIIPVEHSVKVWAWPVKVQDVQHCMTFSHIRSVWLHKKMAYNSVLYGNKDRKSKIKINHCVSDIKLCSVLFTPSFFVLKLFKILRKML